MSLTATLFAGRCVCCDHPLPSGFAGRDLICDHCTTALAPPPPLEPPAGLDHCVALTDYTGVGRDLVVALKFRGRHAVAPWLARRMVAAMPATELDLVTWAPTTRARRRDRGYDQSELLARRLAPLVHAPWYRCLVHPAGRSQTGCGRAERLAGPVFAARRGLERVVAGRRVLLVDDVITTGSTMAAAARVLHHAGARSVVGVAVAHTPDR